MVRGPQSIHTLDRVVTARDYEQFAVAASGGVSRARAVTRADAWVGAAPGEVQVFVVPGVSAGGAGGVSRSALEAANEPHGAGSLAAALHSRQPIGTRVRVSWAGLKPLRVEASVVVHRAEDRAAVEQRLRARLDRMLSPVPVEGLPGWPFGEHLRVAPGVRRAAGRARASGTCRTSGWLSRMCPSVLEALQRDPHQPRTWFCAGGGQVFRSVDDARRLGLGGRSRAGDGGAAGRTSRSARACSSRSRGSPTSSPASSTRPPTTARPGPASRSSSSTSRGSRWPLSMASRTPSSPPTRASSASHCAREAVADRILVVARPGGDGFLRGRDGARPRGGAARRGRRPRSWAACSSPSTAAGRAPSSTPG